MLLKFVIILFAVAIISTVITQIVLPLLTNRKLFPAFRMPTETDVKIENLYQKHEEFNQIKYADDLAKELNSKIEKFNKESK